MSGGLQKRSLLPAEGRIRRCIMSGAWLLFWPLALLTLAALALHVGAWPTEYSIAGPFAAETKPAQHSLIVAVPSEPPAAWWRQPLIGDSVEKAYQSILKLRIDGREIGPAHSHHEAIREGTTRGFRHWGANVIFSLPSGVKNAPETVATIRYSVQPRAWLTLALMVSSAWLGWLLYQRPLRRLARRSQALISQAGRRGEEPIAVLLRIPYLILLGLCGLAMIGSSIYLASSLYALATGWALPTTALIRWSSTAQWAARNEPYLGHLLLICAGFGAIVTWLAGSNQRHRDSIASDERLLRRFLLWSGFPIAACTLVFSVSAMWAGMVRPDGTSSMSVGGLIPFSDAANYLTAAHDQAKDGAWNAAALHRPLAAAFRSALLFFSNYSLSAMLILQACLLAAAACFAAYALATWRGIWAATAFLGLTCIYARTFVPTTLTEPLGLFWALLAIPFFIASFRSSDVRPALIAFAMTALALMTRTGSMFTIPFLLLWLVWQFGRDVPTKLRIGAVSIGILIGIFGLNSLLQKTYGTGKNPGTGNFAYVLCGLSMGTTWDGCLKQIAPEGKPPQGDVLNEKLYAMAADNIRARPGILLGRLVEGARAFVDQFPEVIWKGYGTEIEEPGWLWRTPLTVVCLIGLFVAARRATRIELAFWALLWTSIVASSSIVFLDDGPRTLAASHPLMALFLAIGFSSAGLASREAPSPASLSRYGTLGLIVAAALYVCIPWTAHRFSPVAAMAGDGLLAKQDEAIVFGGRRMSGFLVVEDGSPLRSDIPTLHLADFDAVVRKSGVESYQGLLHPVAPPVPFGFVFAPRVEKGVLSLNQYIVPAEVMERRDVAAWRFQLKRWGTTGLGEYWYFVSNAEPWRR
ncbi:MAG: hypothetical protein JWR80_3891 [Bradyrhizobium sp.]|nr:hypothetical protein [Bradyrhizobium sp.]